MMMRGGPYSKAEWVEWVEMMMDIQKGLDRAGLDEATVAMPLTQTPPTPAVSEVPLAGASSDDSDGDGSSTYGSSLLTASTAPTWASTAPTLTPAQGQPAQGSSSSSTINVFVLVGEIAKERKKNRSVIRQKLRRQQRARDRGQARFDSDSN